MTAGLHPGLEPAGTLDWTRLDAFLSQHLPEDERLDYKDRVGPSVAETASAMANTRGGTIIVGVRENPSVPNSPGSWPGVAGDPQGALNNTNWSYCTPAIRLQSLPVINPTTGDTVLVVAVAPALQPPHWHRDKGILIRIGDQNRLAQPELLEAWYQARSMGNPSERALRARATLATTYGSPGFSLNIWPTSAVPGSQFGPATDDRFDSLAAATLPPYPWEGRPLGDEYVLEAERDDRVLMSAISEQAYVRFLQVARQQPPAASVDFVVTTHDLVNELARRLVFAELALTTVCNATPPFRVELLITYGSNWRLMPPPASLEFTDPQIPATTAVESPARVDTVLNGGGAAEASTVLLVGTMRRLRWRNVDSLVRHLTSNLGTAVSALYAAT